MCYPKSVVHDRFFSWIRTSIPPVVGESSDRGLEWVENGADAY